MLSVQLTGRLASCHGPAALTTNAVQKVEGVLQWLYKAKKMPGKPRKLAQALKLLKALNGKVQDVLRLQLQPEELKISELQKEAPDDTKNVMKSGYQTMRKHLGMLHHITNFLELPDGTPLTPPGRFPGDQATPGELGKGLWWRPKSLFVV